MEWITTSTILQRMKNLDDRSMWDRFHARFRRPLLAFSRKCGLAEAESEDVVQEIMTVFIESYRKGEYDKQKGRLSSWLFGIAYNQIANRRRTLAKEGRRRDDAGSMMDDPVTAEHAWDAEWESSVLEQCMHQVRQEVSERTFEAFRLLVREGRSPDEAAEQLQMTRAHVYVAKYRVLKRLADLMNEFEHFRS